MLATTSFASLHSSKRYHRQLYVLMNLHALDFHSQQLHRCIHLKFILDLHIRAGALLVHMHAQEVIHFEMIYTFKKDYTMVEY